MPLDRQSIERRDFPVGRRGYEPEVVDSHLAGVADEVESLQRSARRRSNESVAQAASEQVRAIVEAAEASAVDIERAAEEEAAQIRSDATRDAERTRSEAVARARDHVGQVSEATSSMLQRVEAMQHELDSLVESLRTGANRVNADLSLLEGNMADLHRAAGGGRPSAADAPFAAEAALPRTPERDRFVDEDLAEPAPPRRAARPAPPAAAAPAPAPAPPRIEPEPEPAPAPPRTEAEPEPAPVRPRFEPEPEPERLAAPATEPLGGDGDVEGARLIALNMALNGQSREETDRYLAENFELRDRGRLLDEVYASVEG